MKAVRILWINPVHTSEYDTEMAANLNAITDDATTVDVVSFDPPGPRHLEFATHGAAIAPRLLSTVRWAKQAGYDAATIGCFYDPGLRAAREIAGEMVVTAPAEACLHTATVLGGKVSILVANRTCMAEIREAAERVGLAHQVASYRDLDMRVSDFQADTDSTVERILAHSRDAVTRDGADVVVLGCTLEYGLGQQVQREIGVPVLDATSTPVVFAEYLVSLGRRFGWHASGLDYQPPPADEQEWLPAAILCGPITRG